MHSLLRDIRFGLKLLRREKAFSLTILVTLAVCIGANVAIFSVVHAVLLEPLPYPSSDRLVAVYNSYPGAGVERASNGSTDFFYRRERVEAFDEVAVWQPSSHTVGEAGSTERVLTARVTPSFFDVVGVKPLRGRTFTEDEMEPGNEQKAVLSYGYWQDQLGGRDDAVGGTLRVDGRPFTVVGVLPEGFQVVGREEARFFVPIPFTSEQRTLEGWHNNNYRMLARLRPGATVALAQAQNDALNQAMIDEWPVPNARQILEDAGFHTVVVDAREDVVRDIRSTLYLLWAGVAFVLLIGCVNVANLVLGRGQVRAGELATRLALGAGRSRLARQILTEALVMAVLGSALGVGLGALGLKLLAGFGADGLPRASAISIDGTVLIFTLGLAVAAAVLFGGLPAYHAFRGDLSSVFRAESRTGTASRRAVLVRGALVTGQVALAFLLLSGAGLMFVSFRAAVSVDPGFEPANVLTGFVSLPSARYPDQESRRLFIEDLMARAGALPEVEAVSAATQLPFSGNNSSSVIWPEGYQPRPGESLLSPYQTRVFPGYMAAMDIQVLEGRSFEPSDGPDQPNVIIIDEWLAHRYWPDSSPLGERMVWGTVPGVDSLADEDLYTVVGVVETVKQNDLTASEHVGAYYFPLPQNPSAFLTVVARTTVPPEGVVQPLRQTLRDLDPELPLFEVKTLEQRIDDSLVARRAPMTLLMIFAGVALFLAVVGLYGILAYSVSQRTKEMGIRMAMGSSPERIFRLVVGDGVRVVVLGLVLGATGALALNGLIRSLLFGVQPGDPRVMAGVATLLATVAVAACLVPAWRATRVDPSTALHE